jgi:sulfoxide reductase heme-binding subunit YedZ
VELARQVPARVRAGDVLYATAHLAAYAALDLELRLGEVAAEIVKRPYLVVGFAAWLLLVPLALTSSTGWIRRLGGRRWNRLHKLTYPVAALGVVHFWMSQKKDHSEPIAWGLGFAALFAWRWWYARRAAAA